MLWVGGVCIFIGKSTYRLLRVCNTHDVTITATNEAGYASRKPQCLSNWSAVEAPPTKGRVINVRVAVPDRCLRTYTNLPEGYADIAQPAHKMIYATPGPGTPHPIALINRRNFMVCPTCHTVFATTVELSEHLGLSGKWARMSWKTFV